MNDRVTVDIQDGVADVRMVRTDKMNALDNAMFEALVSTGLPTSPAAWSASGSLVLAAANTSGFTPWRICAASSSEPANE